MKKVKFISVIALAAICAVFAAFATVGCGSSTLEVDTSGAVTVFAVGDTFSSDGIVVYEKQSDGKNVRVPRDGYTVTEPDMSAAGEKTVTITAGERTVTYTISVVVPEVTATFAGDITGGLGGGVTITYPVEFRCYNTLEWELWYYDGMPGTSGESEVHDSGRYTVEDGVYTMTLTTTTVHTATDAEENVSFSYTGVGLPVAGGMLTATFNGMLTLQK